MENVAGEQGLALQQLFAYISSYSFKNSDRHKISFSDDGGLNLAILIFSTCFFHFWHSLSYSWFSHDVTKIRTTKLLIFLRFYFNDV